VSQPIGVAQGGRVHFIGIAGTAMATLAAMLKARGYDVQGSDHGVYPPMSDFLERERIRVFDDYRAAQITADLDVVVVGNAISRGNVELEEVLDRRLRFVSLPEAIRDHFLWPARSVVIAGTHGKTTTTSLTGWLLTAGGLDPSVLVGGIAENFGSSYRLGGGREFVIEGDEYDSAFFDKTAKFLKYLPTIAVIGNLEYDHADIYPDMDSLRTAFKRLVALVPRSGHVVLGIDSPEAAALTPAARSDVQTFGMAERADWRASGIETHDTGTAFTATHRGREIGRFEMPLFGEHNVKNALAAIVVARLCGVDADAIARGLATFKSVRRRLELRGTAAGVSVYDDFAHHPTAIRETLRAMRARFPDRRIWGVFEPRSATSCRRIFQDDFARAFLDSGADRVVLAAVYRSTLPEDQRLSAERLVQDVARGGTQADYWPAIDDIVQHISAEARSGDLVVIMSNGGFGGIHDKLLKALAVRPLRP